MPPRLRSYIEEKLPTYLTAPEEFEEPNETSWTYFKKVLDARQARCTRRASVSGRDVLALEVRRGGANQGFGVGFAVG